MSVGCPTVLATYLSPMSEHKSYPKPIERRCIPHGSHEGAPRVDEGGEDGTVGRRRLSRDQRAQFLPSVPFTNNETQEVGQQDAQWGMLQY